MQKSFSVLVSLLCISSVSGERLIFTLVPQAKVEQRFSSGPQKNKDRMEQMVKLFESAGCTGENLQLQRVSGEKLSNVICIKPGASESRIVIGAHFDCIEKGRGVIDNWSGASMLPSLFESLNQVTRQHTLVFVAFSDEEKGLIGSHHFVSKLKREDREQIRAMINLDSLGTGPTKVEVVRGDKELINAIGMVAGSLKLPLAAVNLHQVGRSDSDSFQDAKIPALSVHSLTADTFKVLHNSRDNWDAVKMEDYYLSYRLMTALVAYLDQTLP